MGLIDDQLRHEFYLQRLATQLLNEGIQPGYREAYLAARKVLLEAEELRSVTQVNRITSAIRQSVRQPTAEAWARVTEELEKMAEYEAQWYARAVSQASGAAVAAPAADKVARYISSTMMSLGETATGQWGDFVRRSEAAFINTAESVVKNSYAQGQTVRQAVTNLRQNTEGLLYRQAESLVRTGVQHYAVQAREAMAFDNRDIIKKRYALVVFDNRTTLTCLAYGDSPDNPWDLDDPNAPVFPAHFGCRTTWLFLTEGQDAPQGLRAAVGGETGAAAREAYQARRSRTDGKVMRRGRRDDTFFDPKQVRAATKPDQFLRSQPSWFVEDTLGPTRARLFKDGGLSLSSFTDAQGRPLTLDQIRVRDADAFRRAGL